MICMTSLGLDKQDIDFDAKLTDAHCRISRRIHPDKSSAKNATEKFQAFGAIYKILRDPDARALLENGGKVDGNRTVQLDLQKRDRFDRPIRMVLSIDSQGKLRHRFHKPSNCISILRIGTYVFLTLIFLFIYQKTNAVR